MPNERFNLAEKKILNRLEKELPTHLYYHGYHHTLDVLQAAMIISKAEKIEYDEIKLLRVAICYHDAGFLYMYNGHEEKSCEIACKYLEECHFTKKEIDAVCDMIMATKIPQTPKNVLSKIIADADLDYLGREDVDEVAKTLKKELNEFMDLQDERIWIKMQIAFLKSHNYHTSFSNQNRGPQKMKYLKKLEDSLQ